MTINYKGEQTYNTKLGAFFSIGIQVLVLVQLAQLTIDMINMNDPAILSYERPLYEEEVNSFDYLNMDEYRYNFGVYFTSRHDPEAIAIPESVGRVVYHVFDESNPQAARENLPYVNCTDLFSWVNMNQT